MPRKDVDAGGCYIGFEEVEIARRRSARGELCHFVGRIIAFDQRPIAQLDANHRLREKFVY